MNKHEFIEQLRRSLSSVNDYTFVNDTISYYENYIESQIRMGKSEQEVMDQLGDPRLIAKSIRATHTEENETNRNSEYTEYYEEEPKPRHARTVIHLNGRQFCLPTWLVKLLTIVLIGLVVFVSFTLLSFLAPYLCLGILVFVIYRMITGNRRW